MLRIVESSIYCGLVSIFVANNQIESVLSFMFGIVLGNTVGWLTCGYNND